MRHLLSAATGAACLLTSACGRDESQSNTASKAANAVQRPVVPNVPIPAPEPPLDRERLLVAAMRAASDFAAGADDRERQKQLAGRKFEFRIRFGCGWASGGSAAPFSWSMNGTTGALKVRATQDLSPNDPPVEALAGQSFETVEGFWVRRPWLLGAVCPRTAEPASTEQAASGAEPKLERNVGIAQFFTPTGPRTLRRSGRAYEATKRLEAGDRPVEGFDLLLAGRLAPLPDGRVIACTASLAGDRPTCVISVEFGKVSIERADTREQLAQWGDG